MSNKKLKMLAIDLGASSGRGIVGSFDGKKLAIEEIHRFSNDVVNLGGSLHWNMLGLFQDIKLAIRNCALSENKDIKSIAIDTWGVDYGLLDKDGKLLENPYCYRDTRTVDGIMEEVYKVIPKEELYAITGTQFINFNTIFQLYSVLKNRPHALENAKDLLFTPDLLKYFLTGEKQTEYTIASTSQLLDAKARDWDMSIIKRIGLPERIFGKITPPGTYCGKLSKHIIEEVGDIDADVISTASHDTAAAVVSVPAKEDGFVYISSGTWSLMGSEIPEPLTDGRAYSYNFTNEGGAERKIRFLKNIMGLWLEQESRRQWIREGEKLSFDELSNMAMSSSPLKCIIDPNYLAFQTPGNMPKRIYDYCRMTGQKVPETKGEIVRCIFDSLALCYRDTVNQLDDVTGRKAPFINIVGGGTKEVPLSRLCANACGRPVYAGPVEATVLGNIAVQAIAAGEIKDVHEARQIISESFDIYTCEPNAVEKDMWDDGYDRYKTLIEKYGN